MNKQYWTMEFGGVEHNIGMGIGGNAKSVERLELSAEKTSVPIQNALSSCDKDLATDGKDLILPMPSMLGVDVKTGRYRLNLSSPSMPKLLELFPEPGMVVGGREKGIQNEGGRGREVIGGRGVRTDNRGSGGVNNASRCRARGKGIGPNNGANNGLVVKEKGSNQGILIGRERVANTQVNLGRGRGANNGIGNGNGRMIRFGGRGRGRGGTTAALFGVVIRERNPKIGVDPGTNKGANSGKAKDPIVMKGKAPIAPRVGLPVAQVLYGIKAGFWCSIV
ncbi:hypothetical protein RHMOL_Rhmol08G0182700 [Rhododendron molle]|uniref:Uncharacterized protein n=1 Tax=Rhododendron molle TaxID=49168 RepID=A0ACC0MQZ9_RHOML|nr:hypothetical protein RHMOL_Rhmol08G0182700 [Rhododendron molle]